VPDAPISLFEHVFVTSRTVIEFEWLDGESDGGAEILDYRVSWD
jgi:hypothetical protein